MHAKGFYLIPIQYQLEPVYFHHFNWCISERGKRWLEISSLDK